MICQEIFQNIQEAVVRKFHLALGSLLVGILELIHGYILILLQIGLKLYQCLSWIISAQVGQKVIESTDKVASSFITFVFFNPIQGTFELCVQHNAFCALIL